jgi:aminoglycoside 3-N-acetyltransferase
MGAISVTAAEITAGLRALGVRGGGRLFVHSSLRAFGHVEGGTEAVCAALIDAVGPEGTVAVPTFTWSANHARETVTFDVSRDPCEVGRIPETFRRLPGALRSEHLCHSLAAVGPLAPRLMGDGVHPFGRGSSMYALYELDFQYAFLGCDFSSCTALHTVEELAAIPYRYYRHFSGSTVIRPDGSRVPSRAVEFLRYLPFQNDFASMEAVFRGRGVVRSAKIGAATVLLSAARAIVDIGLEIVRADPGALLTAASRENLRKWDRAQGSR